MKNIVIKVDGQRLDLPSNLTSLPLTFGIKDRKGIATNTGSRSEYSFTFPSTKQNDRIFKRFWQANILNSDIQVLLAASIEVDGLPFFQGKAQLISSTATGAFYARKGGSYKLAFYGNNVDWVSDLKGKKLFEMPFTSHTFDSTTILAAFNYSYPTNDFTYNLVKWKAWENASKVLFKEFSPMISVAAAVKYCFDSIGYTLESNFFDSDFFQRLYIPLNIPDKFDSGFSDDYLRFEGNTSFNTSTLPSTYPVIAMTTATATPAIGSNPYNATTGEYTAPYDGFYKFVYSANISNVTGSGIGFRIGVTELGTGAFADEVGDNSAGSFTANAFLKGEYVFELDAGDRVAIAASGDYVAGDADIEVKLEVFGECKKAIGLDLDFKYLIPQSWGCLPLVQGLAHAFNLVFNTNTMTRKVTVEPADPYQLATKNPTSQTLEEGFYKNEYNDLTKKIDLSKDAELKNIYNQPKQIALTWKYDGETEEAINEAQELGFFAARFNLEQGRGQKDQQTIENPFFAACLTLLDNTIKSDTSERPPQIPLIWGGNFDEDTTLTEAKQDYLPRLLYKEYDSNDFATIRVDNGAGGFTDRVAPLAYQVNYNDTTGVSTPLSFANLTVNGVEQVGLLQRFYLAEMKRQEVGKEMEERLFWSENDINRIDYRTKVVLNNASFILSEVNSFNVLSNSSTKTFLRFDARVLAGDFNKIESSTLSNKFSS